MNDQTVISAQIDKQVIRPDARLQRTRGGVNVDFFKKWTPETTYVLGYFAADGAMYINSLGARYLNFVSTDYELLKKIKTLLDSKHEIKLRKKGRDHWQDCYWLQIGSKELFNDLTALGLTPNKEFTLKLPSAPEKLFRHFVRGYFDGDGCVSHGYFGRANRNGRPTFFLLTRFIGASRSFLEALSSQLSQKAGVIGGSVIRQGRSYQLSYSKGDSIKLFHFMYNRVPPSQYLERKYKKFVNALACC